jgi:hypothetical protein
VSIPALIQDTKGTARKIATLACLAGLTVLLALAALFFLTLAAFIWAEDEYGLVAAALGLGVFFLALALVTLATTAWVRRRRFSQRIESTPQMLRQANNNPIAIAGSVEILRLMGERNLFPAVVLSAAILTALQTVRRNKSGTAAHGG